MEQFSSSRSSASGSTEITEWSGHIVFGFVFDSHAVRIQRRRQLVPVRREWQIGILRCWLRRHLAWIGESCGCWSDQIYWHFQLQSGTNSTHSGRLSHQTGHKSNRMPSVLESKEDERIFAISGYRPDRIQSIGISTSTVGYVNGSCIARWTECNNRFDVTHNVVPNWCTSLFPQIVAIADRHNKSTAQVLIRYQIQRGHVVIPKSITTQRIRANNDVFDFALSDEEMTTINSFDCNGRLFAFDS